MVEAIVIVVRVEGSKDVTTVEDMYFVEDIIIVIVVNTIGGIKVEFSSKVGVCCLMVE